MKFFEISNPIDEGVHDPHIFKAIFMAGASGSGKSTVSKMLFSGTGLKPVNVDTIENFYRAKQKRVTDRDVLRSKKDAQRKSYQEGKLGMIIDGTGRYPPSIIKLKKLLEADGYETAMVFVDVDLDTSLQRVKSRAQIPGTPDYGREIDPGNVEMIYREVQKGKHQLQPHFANFWSIDNSGSKPDLSGIERQVARWLAQPVTNPVAQKWISAQSMANRRNAPST